MAVAVDVAALAEEVVGGGLGAEEDVLLARDGESDDGAVLLDEFVEGEPRVYRGDGQEITDEGLRLRARREGRSRWELVLFPWLQGGEDEGEEDRGPRC